MDRSYLACLTVAREDARCVNAESDAMRLVADPHSGEPPCVYHGLLRGCEHFRWGPTGIAVSADPLSFSLHLPADYLRSVDPNLQFRVLEVHADLVHPNVHGGLVCLGPGFRPGTRLRALAEIAYGILSSRVFATDHAFSREHRDYYLRHIEDVRRLRAQRLWRGSAAASVRVDEWGADAPETPR